MSSNESKKLEYVNSEYGKNAVRILYVRREGQVHCIKELSISVHIRLNTVNEYLNADNSRVIPTDTIKNTIEALAKCNGIRTIEEFGLDICEHFINTFCHVVYCNAFIHEVPWQRLEKDNTPHVHAFLYSSEGIRFCEVEQTQDRELPTKVSWMLLLGHHKQAITHRLTRKQSTVFRHTFWIESHRPIEEIEVILSNIHYSVTNLEKLGISNDKEIFTPQETPFGACASTLRRKDCSKNLRQMPIDCKPHCSIGWKCSREFF
ncbi:hypothetical protein Chor_003530 [Crotalus horridus]